MLKDINFRFIVALGLIFAFVATSVYIPEVQAGEIVMPLMPKPGSMVNLSSGFVPAHLKGITIHPDNALQFDFLINKGEGRLDDAQKRQEYKKLVKYFLASLTVPDTDQWVNLSPYEKDRIIKDNFGKTEMGRDLLGQDYLLKQITSSLIYPESGLGKSFWDKVYERAYKEYGNDNIPVNTFNKVWIVPDQAIVYESGNTAYILKSHLKVMLEEDYLSLSHAVIPAMVRQAHHASNHAERSRSKAGIHNKNDIHTIGSQIIREIVLPALEKEVNEGKNFAPLRQVYSGMILATWYKKALKESFLGKIYADRNKIQGLVIPDNTNVIPAMVRQAHHASNHAERSRSKAGIQNKNNIEYIYEQYLKAFKKGVYNYIKEDVDKYTKEVVPRKYFSGGVVNNLATIEQIVDKATVAKLGPDVLAQATQDAPNDKAVISLVEKPSPDAAMMAIEYYRKNIKILERVKHTMLKRDLARAKTMLGLLILQEKGDLDPDMEDRAGRSISKLIGAVRSVNDNPGITALLEQLINIENDILSNLTSKVKNDLINASDAAMAVHRYRENEKEELGAKESGYPWMTSVGVGMVNFFGRLFKENGKNAYVLGITVNNRSSVRDMNLVTVEGSPNQLSYMLTLLHNDRNIQNDIKGMLRENTTADALAGYLIYKINEIARAMPSDSGIPFQVAKQLAETAPFNDMHIWFPAEGQDPANIIRERASDFLKSRPANENLIRSIVSKFEIAPDDSLAERYYSIVLKNPAMTALAERAIKSALENANKVTNRRERLEIYLDNLQQYVERSEQIRKSYETTIDMLSRFATGISFSFSKNSDDADRSLEFSNKSFSFVVNEGLKGSMEHMKSFLKRAEIENPVLVKNIKEVLRISDAAMVPPKATRDLIEKSGNMSDIEYAIKILYPETFGPYPDSVKNIDPDGLELLRGLIEMRINELRNMKVLISNETIDQIFDRLFLAKLNIEGKVTPDHIIMTADQVRDVIQNFLEGLRLDSKYSLNIREYNNHIFDVEIIQSNRHIPASLPITVNAKLPQLERLFPLGARVVPVETTNKFAFRFSLIQDAAMTALAEPGGIDMNSANLDLQIRRDGKGVPLPYSQQDWLKLNSIQGFEPRIIEIVPVTANLPILLEIASLRSLPAGRQGNDV